MHETGKGGHLQLGTSNSLISQIAILLSDISLISTYLWYLLAQSNIHCLAEQYKISH